MANTLGNLIGPLYEALDTVSREFVGFIPSVTRDNGNFARAAVGQTVTAFTTPTVAMSDIVPGVTAPNDGDQVIGSYGVTITRAKRVPIRWNGEETLGLNNAGPGQRPILIQQFMQAMRTIANGVEVDLANAAYQAASRAVGTPGTAPFGTAGDLSDFAGVARILDVNGTPMGDRHLVINDASMANIRGKQSVLYKVNEAGNDDLLRRGSVGEVQGMLVHYAPQLPFVTKGTGTGYLINGGAAAGATVLPVNTGTGTVNPGDAISIAGDPNKYMVTAGGTGVTSITIGGPGLKVAAAGSAAITINNSYAPNVAFSRDALLLATRMPALPTDLDGSPGDMADDRTMVVDPFTGIAFEVSVYKQYRQIHFEVAAVWGVAGIKPEHIAVLQG